MALRDFERHRTLQDRIIAGVDKLDERYGVRMPFAVPWTEVARDHIQAHPTDADAIALLSDVMEFERLVTAIRTNPERQRAFSALTEMVY